MRRRTLLILAEDPLTRWALQEALAVRHRVLAAETGPEALDLLDGARHPDLVLVEISLPAEDGLRFLSKVRKACPDVRVLAMTASRSLRLRQEIRRRGAEYVSKPASMGDLRVSFSRFLRPPPGA